MKSGYLYLVMTNLSHGFKVGEIVECMYNIDVDIYRCVNSDNETYVITSFEVFEIGEI